VRADVVLAKRNKFHLTWNLRMVPRHSGRATARNTRVQPIELGGVPCGPKILRQVVDALNYTGCIKELSSWS
jgi:hypothetical protein